MRIEHVAMYVNDLEAARDFFVRYLGGRSDGGYHNTTTGFRSYFITFEEGPRLEVMTKPRMDDAVKGINRTGYAHIAFSVGSEEAVDELRHPPRWGVRGRERPQNNRRRLLRELRRGHRGKPDRDHDLMPLRAHYRRCFCHRPHAAHRVA